MYPLPIGTQPKWSVTPYTRCSLGDPSAESRVAEMDDFLRRVAPGDHVPLAGAPDLTTGLVALDVVERAYASAREPG